MKSLLCTAATFTLSLAALACGNALHAATFEGLGGLPGITTLGSDAFAVSANGQVVVGRVKIAGQQFRAIRWTKQSGMVDLGDIPGAGQQQFTTAQAVSADGSVIAGSSGQAFRWTQQTGMVGLGTLPGGTQSSGFGLSADGAVVVGFSSTAAPGATEAFRWTSASGMVGLGDLPGGATVSTAMGASGDGANVVGASRSTAGNERDGEPFRWTAATGLVGLGGLPGSQAVGRANAITGDSAVIVGGVYSADGSEQAFRSTAAGMVGLGDLAGGKQASEARAVSADGSVIVGTGDNNLGQQAFVWTESGGMRSLFEVLTRDFRLNLTGWNLEHATGVSADGRTIVGRGTDASGLTAGWIATLPASITFAGDVNNDGDIGFLDLGFLLNNYEQPGVYDSGDLNNSGTVDFVDLGILLNNYGQQPPLVTLANPVPEPSSALCAVISALGLATVVRGRWKQHLPQKA